MKSQGCLLTHWLPLTRILFRIVRICSSWLKWNYLKNEKLFLSFFVPFMESISDLKHFQKKKIVIANLFWILETVKDLVRPESKKHRFRTSFNCEYVKGSQTLVKSSWEYFYQYFHQSMWKWLGKYLPYWSLKSYGCLLTHWLAITSILFRIVRICRSPFKCNYVDNKNVFVSFLFNLWNPHQILKVFQKKEDRHS